MDRTTAAEILDTVVPDPAQLAQSFQEVFGVNRYLGGLRALQHHLSPWVGARWDMTVLDVAGGTGDVAGSLHAWARRKGTYLQMTVLDNHPQVVELARTNHGPGAKDAAPNPDGAPLSRPAVAVVEGDARHLPFGDGAFDVAICNLALHHFEPAEAAAVLCEMDRVARLGWVVTDLERHPLAYAGARLLAATLWRNPITRHDGPLSVRRAYRADEVRRMLHQAGLNARVHTHFPYRWAAVCRKAP